MTIRPTRNDVLAVLYDAALRVNVVHVRDVTLADVRAAWGALSYKLCRTRPGVDLMEN